MPVCLHVGLHKTGTSSIQSILSANHETLLRHGVEFPLLGWPPGEAKAHRYVAAWLRDTDKVPTAHLARLQAWRPTQPRTIISAEGFSRGEPAAIERVRAFFGDDTHIVCALRDPVSHLRSHHRQKSIKRTAMSLPDYLAGRHAEMLSDATAYYRYDDKIARWRSAFRVSTLIYDGDANMGDAFLEVAGVRKVLGDRAAALPRQNPGMDDVAAALLRTLTRLGGTGRIGPRAVQWTRTEIRRNPARIAEALKGLAVNERVDVRAFTADFARLNPLWAHLVEGAPDAIDTVIGFTLSDDALLDRVSDVLERRL